MLETRFDGVRVSGDTRFAQRLKSRRPDFELALQNLADELRIPLPPVVVETDPGMAPNTAELRSEAWGILVEPVIDSDAEPADRVTTTLRRAASRLLKPDWITAHLKTEGSEPAKEDVDALLDACRELLDANVRLLRLDAMVAALRDPERIVWAPETDNRHIVAALPGTFAAPVERPSALADQLVEIGRAAILPDQLRAQFPRGEMLVSTLSPRRDANGVFEPQWLAALVDAVKPAAEVKAVLVVAAELRREIRRRLRPKYPDLLVVTRHELPRGIALRRFALAMPVP